jgi:hypothetical protein
MTSLFCGDHPSGANDGVHGRTAVLLYRRLAWRATHDYVEQVSSLHAAVEKVSDLRPDVHSAVEASLAVTLLINCQYVTKVTSLPISG